MTQRISFEELVDAVKNNELNLYKNPNTYRTDLNTFDFQLIKIYPTKTMDKTIVLMHRPTDTKVRVKIIYPFDDVPVEVIELMPTGYKKYTYVADYNLAGGYTYSLYEHCYVSTKKNFEFEIPLFCSL